jgi:outer membrane protein OmpA-like peptidoglycan-associated protein
MTIFDEDEPARAVWLTTLADLSLLLVGFFVFLQVNTVDSHALAAGMRAGFGMDADQPAPSVKPAPAMALDLATVTGFAAGSTDASMADAIAWAQTVARDPRIQLQITGETDGSAADVDSATGSAAILAADRARAVATALVRAHVVAPNRIHIATGTGQRRAVLTLGFDGGRP